MAERDVRAAEHIIIHQLAQQFFFNQQATTSILTNGLVIVSHTNHGEVHKANPACDMLAKSTGQIITLATKLGLDQKAFSQITDIDSTEDEDDPITDALSQIKS